MAFYAVGVDPTEDLGMLESFRRNENHPWPVAEPVGSMIADFRVLKQSTKVVFDKNGVIIYRDGFGCAGSQWPELFERVTGM